MSVETLEEARKAAQNAANILKRRIAVYSVKGRYRWLSESWVNEKFAYDVIEWIHPQTEKKESE